jgi:hypothetical protein
MNLTTYINRNSTANSQKLDGLASPILIVIIKQIKTSDKQSQDKDSLEHTANLVQYCHKPDMKRIKHAKRKSITRITRKVTLYDLFRF